MEESGWGLKDGLDGNGAVWRFGGRKRQIRTEKDNDEEKKSFVILMVLEV